MTPQALDFDTDDRRYLAELAELVAIPTVSRDADPATMLTAARWLAGRLAFANGRVEPTAGHPVVRGEWLGTAGAPTVLIYGHYDVQPHRRGGRVDLTAVPAGHRRRCRPRPGRHRRQGPGLHRAADGARLHGAGGRPAAQRQVPARGRGGDRQPAPGRVRHLPSRRAGVDVLVRPDEARVPAYTIAPGHPAIRAATAAVYPGQAVLLACIGGTLPATALFERALGAKTLFFSFSTSDENLHAPNEFLRIARLREGMRAWEALWRRLAAEGTLR